MDRVLRDKLSLLVNSTQRGCHVIEGSPGKWHAVVAHQEYDDDFRHGHSTYGPFKSSKAAAQAVYDNESSPGGHSTIAHADVTDAHRDLIKKGVQMGQGGDDYSRDILGRFS